MILGISISHNSTACLVNNQGKVLFCCSEERFSRIKNDWGFPKLSIDYILKNIIGPSKIEKVTIGEICYSEYGYDSFAEIVYLGNYKVKDSFIKNKIKVGFLVIINFILKKINKKKSYQHLVINRIRQLKIKAPVFFYAHHKAHAASTYYSSPYKNSLVLTLDGEGDRLSGSIWDGSNNHLKLITNFNDKSSIGKFYKAVTSSLGFLINRHEGKVTGLAALGDPLIYYNQLSKVLYTSPTSKGLKINSIAGTHFSEQNSFRNISIVRLFKYFFYLFTENTWTGLHNKIIKKSSKSLIGNALGLNLDNITMIKKKNIAASAQKVTEDVVIDIIQTYIKKSKRNLCLAGGVFANVKLNQKIYNLDKVSGVYIHPGMGDEGLALGSAFLSMKNNPVAFLKNVYLGPNYCNKEIELILKDSGLKFQKFSIDLISKILSKALANNNIIGLFKGRSEYGPRALGARSILANPSSKAVNLEVNNRLNRTEFMPFAPVVLKENFDDVFESKKSLKDIIDTAKFMTVTLDVSAKWKNRIAGVVHVDGTARPQVIDMETNELYYKTVKKFYELTGLPCLVNTSFNLHETPIVNSPNDALDAFNKDAVDILVLEDFIVWKSDKFDPNKII